MGGRYKDDANYYNGNADQGECKIWLSRSLEEMDLWKVQYMELREERRCGSGNKNHDGGGAVPPALPDGGGLQSEQPLTEMT